MADRVEQVYEIPSRTAELCCNPLRSRIPQRYLILFLLCFLCFAFFYCSALPSSLQDHIQRDLNISTTTYSLLNSVGSWPNIFLCLIGGYVIDRFLGIRFGAILFSSIILLGEIIFTLGAFHYSFTAMIIARFIHGLGTDNLSLCQSAYCVKWFMGHGEYNFAFAMIISVSRIGASASYLVGPALYTAVADANSSSYSTLGYVIAVGLIPCVLSLYVAIQLAWLERRVECGAQIAHVEAPAAVAHVQQQVDEHGTGAASRVVKIADLFHLPLALWLMSFVCVGFYCAISCFIGQANLFFQTQYGYTSEAANECTSIIYFLSAGASPFAGLLVDRTGRNLSWLIFSCLLGVVVLLAFIFATFISPFLLIILYGLSMTIFASAFWSTIAYTVPQNMLATAYGLVTSMLNLGLALFNMAAGSVVDNY